MKCNNWFPFAFVVMLILGGCGAPGDKQKASVGKAETQAINLLSPSPKNGINGVALPTGSKLVKQKMARPKFHEDASETYSINATMADLESYFADQLGKSGWSQVSSYPGFLFYENGVRKVGIIISQDGQSYEIRGK